MTIPVRLILAAALAASCLPAAVVAETAVLPTVSAEDLRRFARDRADDTRSILFGPDAAPVAAPAVGDCRELYARRVHLMQANVDTRRPFLDEPRHVGAVFVGAIWTPALYYLPYRAVQRFALDQQPDTARAELAALRQASAAQRCFER